MILYSSNSFSSSIGRDINLLFLSSLTLNILTYLLILGNARANGLITLSKYPIKYLELVFISSNFGITILPPLTSQIFMEFFLGHNFFFFCYFCHAESRHYYTIKKNFVIMF